MKFRDEMLENAKKTPGIDENKIIYLKNSDINSSEYIKRMWEE